MVTSFRIPVPPAQRPLPKDAEERIAKILTGLLQRRLTLMERLLAGAQIKTDDGFDVQIPNIFDIPKSDPRVFERVYDATDAGVLLDEITSAVAANVSLTTAQRRAVRAYAGQVLVSSLPGAGGAPPSILIPALEGTGIKDITDNVIRGREDEIKQHPEAFLFEDKLAFILDAAVDTGKLSPEVRLRIGPSGRIASQLGASKLSIAETIPEAVVTASAIDYLNRLQESLPEIFNAVSRDASAFFIDAAANLMESETPETVIAGKNLVPVEQGTLERFQREKRQAQRDADLATGDIKKALTRELIANEIITDPALMGTDENKLAFKQAFAIVKQQIERLQILGTDPESGQTDPELAAVMENTLELLASADSFDTLQKTQLRNIQAAAAQEDEGAAQQKVSGRTPLTVQAAKGPLDNMLRLAGFNPDDFPEEAIEALQVGIAQEDIRTQQAGEVSNFPGVLERFFGIPGQDVQTLKTLQANREFLELKPEERGLRIQALQPQPQTGAPTFGELIGGGGGAPSVGGFPGRSFAPGAGVQDRQTASQNRQARNTAILDNLLQEALRADPTLNISEFLERTANSLQGGQLPAIAGQDEEFPPSITQEAFVNPNFFDPSEPELPLSQVLFRELGGNFPQQTRTNTVLNADFLGLGITGQTRAGQQVQARGGVLLRDRETGNFAPASLRGLTPQSQQFSQLDLTSLINQVGGGDVGFTGFFAGQVPGLINEFQQERQTAITRAQADTRENVRERLIRPTRTQRARILERNLEGVPSDPLAFLRTREVEAREVFAGTPQAQQKRARRGRSTFIRALG